MRYLIITILFALPVHASSQACEEAYAPPPAYCVNGTPICECMDKDDCRIVWTNCQPQTFRLDSSDGILKELNQRATGAHGSFRLKNNKKLLRELIGE